MANFNFEVSFNEELFKGLSDSKQIVIQGLAFCYTNLTITEQSTIGIKSVEAAIRYFIKEYLAPTGYYQARTRIMSHLLVHNWVRYHGEQEQFLPMVHLDQKLTETLILVALGMSNSTMASIFGMSLKGIETRLSSLFDRFDIETGRKQKENPRVLLVVSALLRGNIDKRALAKYYEMTTLDKLKRIIEDPHLFRMKLADINQYIG